MENGTVKFSGEGSVKLNRPMLWKTGMAWITDTAEKQKGRKGSRHFAWNTKHHTLFTCYHVSPKHINTLL